MCFVYKVLDKDCKFRFILFDIKYNNIWYCKWSFKFFNILNIMLKKKLDEIYEK